MRTSSVQCLEKDEGKTMGFVVPRERRKHVRIHLLGCGQIGNTQLGYLIVRSWSMVLEL